MKKIGLVTINDNNNYGNRLQNYALQEYLRKMGYEVVTLKNERYSNNAGDIKYKFYSYLRYVKNKMKNYIKISAKRRNNFNDFNKNIVFSKKKVNAYSKDVDSQYDYFIVGSDQVWKPKFMRMSEVDMLTFASDEKRISYAASFGVNEISDKDLVKLKNGIQNFKKISVREDAGKRIVKTATGRDDVEVLIDPTLLLSPEEWDKVSKRPDNFPKKKYILNYFFGRTSDDRRKKIEKIAEENDYEIINILDKNSEFYTCGPSEFLYLEKNAELICTDSFHSCVFAMIFNKPFVIFDREESDMADLNSRTETLIDKFKLKNRKYNGEEITNDNILVDYSEAYKILEIEREKSRKFLNDALDVKE